MEDHQESAAPTPAPRRSVPAEWPADAALLPLEREVVQKAASGEPVDLLDGSPTDPLAMEAWGPERTIRAALLRRLLVDPTSAVHSRGIRLRGVRISGALDLEAATLRCPLRLFACYLDAPEPVHLNYADVPLLELRRCRFAGLEGERLVVSKKLDLSGARISGPVRLSDAEVSGLLSCSGAEFLGDTNGYALMADGLTVHGRVFLRNTVVTAGALRFVDAVISGQLDCSGASLSGLDPDGYVLYADGLTVGGGVFLRDGFAAAGAIRLPGAKIGGQFHCRGGQLLGSDASGYALLLNRARIGSDLWLDQGFIAEGAVRLHGAVIAGHCNCQAAQLQGRDADGNALVADGVSVGGDLVASTFQGTALLARGAIRLPGGAIAGQCICRGALLLGRDAAGNALTADGLRVGSDLFLDRGFTATGAVSLRAARVGGSCSIEDAQLGDDVALHADGLEINDELRWAPRSPVVGRVYLDRASAGRLVDWWDPWRGGEHPSTHWPSQGRLSLTGFTYDGFGGKHLATVDQRLDWIRCGHATRDNGQAATFAAQPYEQLIRVYRQAGLEADARKVAIAKRNDLRRYGGLTRWARTGNWILDKTIKHGYRPLRAAALLAAVYVVTLVVLWAAQHQPNMIVPAKDVGSIASKPTAEVCVEGYPCFYPAGYAFDAVVPLINLRQAENWRINGSADWGWALVAGAWLAAGLGWAFSTLTVVGYTGLVRKD
jgi:hypothetical protein